MHYLASYDSEPLTGCSDLTQLKYIIIFHYLFLHNINFCNNINTVIV